MAEVAEEVVAEAVPNLEPRAVHGARAERAAEAEEGAKAVLAAKVEVEVKAGLAVGVGARTKARKVTHGAKAGSGGQSHEVAVMRKATPKTERERGAPATAAVAAMLAAVII